MKKLTLFLLSLTLIFALYSCGGNEPEETNSLPPAFSLIQKQTKLTKHSKKGETASFSEEEFNNLLGESYSYITIKSLPESDCGKLIYNGLAVSKEQTIGIDSIDFLKFVPSGRTESANFTFSCDSNSFNQKEIACEIIFTESDNLKPIASSSELKTVSGIAFESTLNITEPNGDDYKINVITYPKNGKISFNGGNSIVYTPHNDFSGNDSLVFSVTDIFGNVSENAVLKITVEENENSLIFADMEGNANHLYAHKMCNNNVMVYRFENGNYYFDPDAPVSKLDFLVMLMTVTGNDSGINAVADSVATDDDGLSSGLKGYLSAANEKGIIKLENGYFSPNESVNVASAAYMVASALKLPDANAESASSGSSDRTISSILATVNSGIFETGEPTHILTKSETAKILYAVEAYMKDNNMSAD